ncbi:unnamed protein product [Clavelina lepadiformis]|uniref:C-type lectin domain-containing protein n=1 Tax=Clavelina lepadiformis TaxID=159417 RepID=A0ABP0FP40_CLALP
MRKIVVIIIACVTFNVQAQGTSNNAQCNKQPILNCNCGSENNLPITPESTQARQGKNGPKGEKGTKGESGSTRDFVTQIEQLERELETAKEEMKWYTASNGYQYRVTPGRHNWQKSREVCQDMGADLTVVGMKDYNTRVSIARVLLKPRSINDAWIGLTDAEQEGVWKWVDGTPATTSNAHWDRGQPDDGGRGQDCGNIWPESRGFRTDDDHCETAYRALCEKFFNPD